MFALWTRREVNSSNHSLRSMAVLSGAGGFAQNFGPIVAVSLD